MVYGLILLVIAAICFSILYGLASRIRKYEFFQGKGKKGILFSWLIAFSVSLLVVLIGGFTNAIVIMLHLLVFLGLVCLACVIIKKCIGKGIAHYLLDITAVAITVIYLSVGWFQMVHISKTEYILKTEKDIGKDLRIVQLTDFHIGLTLNGDDVAELVSEINAENPHIVVITGDFVDDSSTKEDMLSACKALGKLEAKLGVYFVLGNHDEGYFEYRDFSGSELREAMENNGIQIMEDDVVAVASQVYLVGRKDASDKDRKSISELMKNIPNHCYSIILDHQPNDYDNESAVEADLVLSGHTHGGHMFPAGPIGVLMGANDAYYGLEIRDKTNFIVSSGVSGWEIPFKTGTHSEYVVIDIKCSEAK